jgi:NAD(P)-dependent dehydrogenase (short-subunit alcohol dehydrogenase family)
LAIEAVTIEAAHYPFDVNVFGYARGLLHMQAQESDHIINVTSAVGKVSMAAFGWDAATKHAIEALSDALRNEVKQFGIKVTLIEPRLIDTEFLELQAEQLKNTLHPPAYHLVIDGVPKALSGKSADPSSIGKAVVDAAGSYSPPVRHALPTDPKAALLVRRYLGDGIFHWAVRRMMGL